MAVTTQNSTEYGNQIASPVTKQAPSVLGGRIRVAKFTHVQSGAGDATSIANLIKLPAGTIRILGIKAQHSDMGASRTLDFGYAANVDVDGNAVAADPDAIVADLDVNNTTDKVVHGDVSLTTRDGLIITAQVNDGTFPDAATLDGWIEYVLD